MSPRLHKRYFFFLRGFFGAFAIFQVLFTRSRGVLKYPANNSVTLAPVMGWNRIPIRFFRTRDQGRVLHRFVECRPKRRNPIFGRSGGGRQRAGYRKWLEQQFRYGPVFVAFQLLIDLGGVLSEKFDLLVDTDLHEQIEVAALDVGPERAAHG